MIIGNEMDNGLLDHCKSIIKNLTIPTYKYFLKLPKINMRRCQILSIIFTYSDKKQPCTFTNKEFSQMLHTSNKSIQRDINMLEKLGYIIKEIKTITNIATSFTRIRCMVLNEEEIQEVYDDAILHIVNKNEFEENNQDRLDQIEEDKTFERFLHK